jgi:ribosomal protein S16
VIRSEAVDAWMKKGAQLSPTVKSLMRRARRQQAAAGGAS